MSPRACSWLVILAVGCAFDSSGQGGGTGGETTSSTGDTSTSATSATTNPTTATTAMTSDATDSTTSMTSTMTTDPDTSATDPETTDDPTVESTDDTATTGSSQCDVENGGCDPDATCSDVDGSIKCTCNAGFVGPGTVCATTPVMPTLRADLPCTGGDCTPNPATCTTDDNVTESVVMAGEDGVVYGVVLAVRGVLEHQEYDDGKCDGQWCIGGTADLNPWNEVTIVVSDPPGEFHPNAGQAGVYEVFAVDEERGIAIAAGATITIEIDGNGTCSIENGTAIVIPGVPPDPQAFNGQFLQLDLVDATIPD